MKNDVEGTLDFTRLYTNPSSENVLRWMSLFEEGKLSHSELRNYWFDQIPVKYKTSTGNVFQAFDGLDSASELIEELEEFIYKGKKEPVNKLIKENENMPSFCGKVFENGEPSYGCRECGMDATCVLCVDCFKSSAHRYHKYRMSTSCGGGFCDCGDVEAWKNTPYCDFHVPSSPEVEPLNSKLPADLYQRFKFSLAFALYFCLEVVNKQFRTDESSHSATSEDDVQNKFFLVMYNDEIHTFDQVIQLLTDITKCTPQEGQEIAFKINYEGRAVIILSDFPSCYAMKRDIERLSSKEGRRFLEVRISSFNAVAYQHFALNILKWVKKIISISSTFRSAFMEILQNNGATTNTPILLDKILVQDPVLWKSARMHWHLVLCAGGLMEYDHKKTVAISFIKNYSEIRQNDLEDENGYPYSTASLSVQLFTVPSITYTLISDYNAMKVIIDYLLRMSFLNYLDVDGNMVFKHISFHEFERASLVLHDIKYLLCLRPMTWSKELREGFCAGVSSFVHLLSAMEGMDPITRQLGVHIEFETEWETSFKLLLRLSPVVKLFHHWCSSDEMILCSVYYMVTNTLKKLADNAKYNKVMHCFGTHHTECLTFDGSVESVSVHLPLLRFWGELFLLLRNQKLCTQYEEMTAENCQSMLELIEPALRIRALVAQFRAGMWRKNGHSLASQIFFYHSSKFIPDALEADIVILQIGASLIDGDTFLVNLISKFGLLNWDLEGLKSDLPETDAIQLNVLVGEFLYLIITLITERFKVGVGDVSATDCLKHQLIHYLLIRPMTHSELMRLVSKHHDIDIETITNDVAVFRITDDTYEKGHYELTNKVTDSDVVNIFFCHYTKEESFEADQKLRACHKRTYGLECCTPPLLPPFLGFFSKVTDLLQSKVMLRIMNMVLNMWIKLEGAGFEGQLHKTLYLIGLALREQEVTQGRFRFTDKAKENDIVQLMCTIYCSTHLKDHKELFTWILNKYRDLSGDSSIESVINHETTAPSDEATHKCLAEKAKANILARMKSMQEKFFLNNAPAIETALSISDNQKSVTCILCQEDGAIEEGGRVMVLACFVQLSKVLIKTNYSTDYMLECSSLQKSCPHISTCGHIMHGDCFDEWKQKSFEAFSSRYPSYDIQKNEFLCPLCRSISNAALPMLPPRAFNTNDDISSTITFTDWLNIVVSLLRSRDSKTLSISSQIATENNVKEIFQTDLSFNTEKCVATQIPPVTQQDSSPNMSSDSLKSINSTQEHAANGITLEEHRDLHVQRSTDDLYLKEVAQFHENATKNNLLKWLHELLTIVCNVAGDVKLSDMDTTNLVLIWRAIAYTIQSIDSSMSFEGKPLFGAFTSRVEHCLENLIPLTNKLGVVGNPKTLASESALKTLSLMLENDASQPSLLEWNCFDMLVVLLGSMSSLVKSNFPGHLFMIEKHIMRLMLISSIAQIFITLKVEGLTHPMHNTSNDDSKILIFLIELFQKRCVGCQTDLVWNELKNRVKPFLRCCAIFRCFMNNEPPIDELYISSNDSFENICKYLQLPQSCNELLGDDVTLELLTTWANHPAVKSWNVMLDPRYCIEPSNYLIPLPKDYSDLLNAARLITCPNSFVGEYKYSQNPAMCLVCGVILCSLSYCCQKDLNGLKAGACTVHAKECGGGVSLFLRIRECQVMMLAGYGRGCFKAAPYLDEYGESDEGLRRGNPMKLCEKSYRKFQLIWLNHGIHEEVSRATEQGGVNLKLWQFF